MPTGADAVQLILTGTPAPTKSAAVVTATAKSTHRVFAVSRTWSSVRRRFRTFASKDFEASRSGAIRDTSYASARAMPTHDAPKTSRALNGRHWPRIWRSLALHGPPNGRARILARVPRRPPVDALPRVSHCAACGVTPSVGSSAADSSARCSSAGRNPVRHGGRLDGDRAAITLGRWSCGSCNVPHQTA